MYKFKIIDISKANIYMGYDSELFCYFPGVNKSYYSGSPTSPTRVGYNFALNKTVYYPTIRNWYDAGVKGTGLSTFVSTYTFAGTGGIGSTISQAILDYKSIDFSGNI